MAEVETVKVGKLTFYFGIEQGSQEWLDLRAGRVTCSNAIMLAAKGPLACIDENRRAAERLTPNGNSYADRGHAIEEEMREQLNNSLRQQGMEIKTCTFITHDDYPGAGYSPDGLIVPINEENWMEAGDFIPVELKAYLDETKDSKGKKHNVQKHTKACKNFEDVPLAARMQCQMEMMMVDAKELFLVLANPEAAEGVPQVKIWNVKRDEQAIERLQAKLAGFATNPQNIDKKSTAPTEVAAENIAPEPQNIAPKSTEDVDKKKDLC